MRDNYGRRPNRMHHVDDSVGIDFVTPWSATDEMRLRQRTNVNKQNESPTDGEQHMGEMAPHQAIRELKHEALDKRHVADVPSQDKHPTADAAARRRQLRIQ